MKFRGKNELTIGTRNFVGSMPKAHQHEWVSRNHDPKSNCAIYGAISWIIAKVGHILSCVSPKRMPPSQLSLLLLPCEKYIYASDNFKLFPMSYADLGAWHLWIYV